MTNIRVGAGARDAGTNDAGSLLVLLNPGRMSRHWLLGIIEGARKAGVRTEAVELGQVWEVIQSGRQSDAAGFARSLHEKRVRAVIGYTFNGMTEWPAQRQPTGSVIPFFEQIGIPHLMWWSDHPQWASEKAALAPDMQPLLCSPNHHHFVKSELAAKELREILGWNNSHGLPVAEDTDRLHPVSNPDPDFDVVTIVGSPPKLDERLEPFLSGDDPDVVAINELVGSSVGEKLQALWTARAPASLRADLESFGLAWIERRKRDPLTGCYRHFTALEPEYPRATAWMRTNDQFYFDALEAMWEFGRWQRTFVIRYLARHLKVGVFGYDWSCVGIPGGGWVDFDDQPRVYARGRVAINISQCNDEEGIAHKPFQMAACGVPMIHTNREGLEHCFDPGEEVETFVTPREALEKVRILLDDPNRRNSMAYGARERVCRDHSWRVRVPQLLTKAGIDVEASFGIKVAAKPIQTLGSAPHPIKEAAPVHSTV